MSRRKQKFIFSFSLKYVCFQIYTTLMKKISPLLLVLVIGSLWLGVYAASTLISGSIGPDHAPGVFSPGTNAWRITLMNEAQVAATGLPGVVVEWDDTSARLTGNFFLQTVGYVSLDRSTVSVIPPSWWDKNVLLPWKVVGNAWSDNAGWIALDSQNETLYSWVYYYPSTGSFSWVAWSNTLGYIDFSWNGWTSDAGLVNRVKIIGNTAWASTFDSLFVANNGTIKTTSVLTPYINKLRKNVGLLTRNAPDSVINTVATTQNKLGALMYYKLSGGMVSLSAITSFCTWNDSPRTIVVEWGDILINRDITGDTTKPVNKWKSCAIIALSNGTTGWNIYISSVPKNIYSYIISEWSVFAGTASTNLYNDSKVKIASLPQNQLYVLGWIISRNTIGGSTTTTVESAACPYTETTCNRDVAIKYDLNFFRNYTKKPENRAYAKDDSLQNYSFVIEYDSRSAGDPPPAF